MHLLYASFVVVCVVITFALVLRTIVHERRNQAWLAQQIAEDIEAGVFEGEDDAMTSQTSTQPEWIYGPRMDVPRGRPVLRTRSTK